MRQEAFKLVERWMMMNGDLLPCQPITCLYLRRVARFDISVPDLELHLYYN